MRGLAHGRRSADDGGDRGLVAALAWAAVVLARTVLCARAPGASACVRSARAPRFIAVNFAPLVRLASYRPRAPRFLPPRKGRSIAPRGRHGIMGGVARRDEHRRDQSPKCPPFQRRRLLPHR